MIDSRTSPKVAQALEYKGVFSADQPWLPGPDLDVLFCNQEQAPCYGWGNGDRLREGGCLLSVTQYSAAGRADSRGGPSGAGASLSQRVSHGGLALLSLCKNADFSSFPQLLSIWSRSFMQRQKSLGLVASERGDTTILEPNIPAQLLNLWG